MRRDYRQGRLGEEIRRLISDLLLREIKDPRLSGIVSVSAVEVTSDGGYATVFISVLGNAEDTESALVAFRSAKGLIKKEIGRQVKLKHVPELLFKADTSMDYGRRITEIIDSLGISEDERDENGGGHDEN